jgi:hypothetical protein
MKIDYRNYDRYDLSAFARSACEAPELACARTRLRPVVIGSDRGLKDAFGDVVHAAKRRSLASFSSAPR